MGKSKEHKKEIQELDLTESMENYLKVISRLEERLKVVRVKNIAHAMEVKMPSVSSALGILEKKRLVNYEKYDYVELTQKGEEVAHDLRKRNTILKEFLITILGVEKTNADRDACKMEHSVSENTINNIVRFMEYIDSCPQKEKVCLKNFQLFLVTGKRQYRKV